MDLTQYTNESVGVNEIVKANCKLCNSKNRKTVETMIENGSNISSVVRFLEKEGDSITFGAIKNHINLHFRTRQNESDLSEYAGQLEKWRKMNMSDSTLIEKYVVMLDREITMISAKNAHVDLVEHRKNQEIILKMQAQVMAMKEASKKLQIEMQPIEILFTALNRIIENKLMSGISIESKKILQDVIDQLKKEIGEIPILGKKLEN